MYNGSEMESSVKEVEVITHSWKRFDFLPNNDVCEKCGVCRRADDKSKPCTGKMPRLSLRG